MNPSPEASHGATTISDLRPDTSGHNLTVKVVEVGSMAERPSRAGGKPQRIVECIVADETASVIFTARNEQVEKLKKGAFLRLEGAKIDMFRGNMRLAVNSQGKIEVVDGVDFEPKVDINMSHVEYELVPVLLAAPAPALRKEQAEPQEAVHQIETGNEGNPDEEEEAPST